MPRHLVRCGVLIVSLAGCKRHEPPAEGAPASALPVGTVAETADTTAGSGYSVLPPRDARDSAVVAGSRAARAALDSQIRADPHGMSLIAGLADGRFTLVARPDAWPDSTEVSYNVYRDGKGQVRLAYQSPYSHSGDWNLDLSHYFDSRESTFLMERQMSFFNGCWNDSSEAMTGVREITTSYFDPTGRLVGRDFVRTTFDGAPAPTEGCNTTMRTPYTVYPSWAALGKATGLTGFLARSAH